MRTRYLTIAAALLLASAGPARAQDETPQDPAFNSHVWANIGFSATSVTGDHARYNHYSDYRDTGLSLDFAGMNQTSDWRATFGGQHVGYDDQRLFASLDGLGTVKASFSFDQIPLNYGFQDDGYLQTPYDGGYKLDYETRQAVQEGSAIAVPGSPSDRTSFLSFFRPLDVKSLRSTFDGRFAFTPAKGLDLKFMVNTFTRQGSQPWGASFGFSQGIEIAAPVDNRAANVKGSLEWGNEKGAVNFGYEHSQFDNHIQELVWDSPYRVTDQTNPTAYITGNGTSQGRLSLPPSNTEETFTGTGVVRLARRTSVAANFAVAQLKQNGTIIPFTINTAIEPIHLDRPTAEAEVDVTNFGFSVNSRPVPHVWLTARYRYLNHDNKTPMFDGEEYVRFDQVAEEGGGETEQFNIKRSTLRLGASYSGVPVVTFRVDYGHDSVDRTHREFATTNENLIKFSADALGSPLYTLRASYQYSGRTGSGFDEEVLVEAGQQPEMRHYDVANRNRNVGTVIFTATPKPRVGFTFSLAAGKDNYPDQEFGLLDNKNQTYSVGVDLYPRDQISFGALYAFEKYDALMKSRNASPGPTFDDPAYDWYDASDETVNTFMVNLDLIKAIEKTDLRFAYDFRKSDANFKYSGPNIDRLTGLGTFEQLPTNVNRFNRVTVDLRYYITSKAALNVTYWFDKYEVDDFAVPEPASGESQPRLDPQGLWSLGYFFRPYTANTGFFRVLVFF
jgi:MtrB/PioB family decaheme-associated outer membrane protein